MAPVKICGQWATCPRPLPRARCEVTAVTVGPDISLEFQFRGLKSGEHATVVRMTMPLDPEVSPAALTVRAWSPWVAHHLELHRFDGDHGEAAVLLIRRAYDPPPQRTVPNPEACGTPQQAMTGLTPRRKGGWRYLSKSQPRSAKTCRGR